MTLQPSREEIDGETAAVVNLEKPAARIESTLEQSVEEELPPPSTVPIVVDVEQRLQSVARMEQEFAQRENFVIPVANVENLRKPESTKDWNVTNQMVQPTHDGKLYVQVRRQDLNLFVSFFYLMQITSIKINFNRLNTGSKNEKLTRILVRRKLYPTR